jgi:hypothetical protein
VLLLLFCMLCVLEASSHTREAQETRERERESEHTHTRPPSSSSSSLCAVCLFTLLAKIGSGGKNKVCLTSSQTHTQQTIYRNKYELFIYEENK